MFIERDMLSKKELTVEIIHSRALKQYLHQKRIDHGKSKRYSYVHSDNQDVIVLKEVVLKMVLNGQ